MEYEKSTSGLWTRKGPIDCRNSR